MSVSATVSTGGGARSRSAAIPAARSTPRARMRAGAVACSRADARGASPSTTADGRQARTQCTPRSSTTRPPKRGANSRSTTTEALSPMLASCGPLMILRASSRPTELRRARRATTKNPMQASRRSRSPMRIRRAWVPTMPTIDPSASSATKEGSSGSAQGWSKRMRSKNATRSSSEPRGVLRMTSANIATASGRSSRRISRTTGPFALPGTTVSRGAGDSPMTGAGSAIRRSPAPEPRGPRRTPRWSPRA